MSAFGLRFELMAAMCVRRHIMKDVNIKKIIVTLAKAGNFKQDAQVTVVRIIVATINIVVAFVIAVRALAADNSTLNVMFKIIKFSALL